MRFLAVMVAATLLLAVPSGVRAQAPEDRYVRVYSLIEMADELSKSGEPRAAVNKYLEAQVNLKDLQRLYPNWNERIVSYRLEYISGKLGTLTGGKAALAEATAETRDGGSLGKAADSGIGLVQMDRLQTDLARLAAQNAFLEAKLREALRVQPASTDPRELARAEERIKSLQKERDLLAITLEQARGRQPASSEPAARAAAQQQQFVTQNAVADVLRKQNDELQKRITELTMRLQDGPGGERLSLKEAVAALQASNRVMKAEQVAMENRLLDLVKSFDAGATARQKEWEAQLAEARAAAAAARKERDELLQKLEAVTKQLNAAADKPVTAATAELERQLESIQARLATFEARQIPYTEEELALFRQAPIKVAASPTNTVRLESSGEGAATGASLAGTASTGVGPALREAQRLVEAGKMVDAEKVLQDAVRSGGVSSVLLARLAAVQMDQDKLSEAEASLKKVIETDAHDPAGLYLLGGVKLRQNKYDDAVNLLSQSIQAVPDNANAHYFLGQALVQQGHSGPAETALRKAITLKPGWGEAHYTLAVLYATRQPPSPGLAQLHYRKALAGGAARNPEFEQRLARALSTSDRP